MEIRNHYAWLWNLMGDTTKDQDSGLQQQDYSQRREIADARALYSKIRRLRQTGKPKKEQQNHHP
jgi:hypothetical protein